MAYVSSSSSKSSDAYDIEREQALEAHEKALRKQQNNQEKALTESNKDYVERLQDLRKSANEEVRKLKEDLYDSHGKRITETESENLKEKRRIISAYETSLERAQEQQEVMADHYDERLTTVLSKANENTENQVRGQKKEFSKIAKEKDQQTHELKKYFHQSIEDEKRRNQSSVDHVIKDVNSSYEKAMMDRNKGYNEYIATEHARKVATIAEKDKELTELKNTSDIRKISVSAKNKIEEAQQQRFAKSLEAERIRADRNIDAGKNQNKEFQENVREHYQKQFHDMSQDSAMRNMAEKKTLVAGYVDLKTNSDLTQQRLEDQKRMQGDRMYRQHIQEVEQIQTRNNEQTKDTKSVYIDEKLKLQTDLELKQRENDREWAFKFHDLKRDYDRKMADQQDLAETEKTQAKIGFDKKLQDQSRESKRLLDDRVRSYELQIKQQEQTFKEKERFLTEHYEEQLDKMKRTNALATQKKS